MTKLGFLNDPNFWIAGVIVIGITVLILAISILRRRRRREEEDDPLYEDLNDYAETQVGEEEPQEKWQKCKKIGALAVGIFALMFKHWYWAGFILFCIFVIIISILYEYGIVR